MATPAALSSRLLRFLSPSHLPAKLLSRRRLSSGADYHGTGRVNIWEDPLSPSKWKEEHLVLSSLSGWGLAIYGGYTLFSGDKKEEVAAPTLQQIQ